LINREKSLFAIKRLKLATEEKLTVGGSEFPTLTFLAVKQPLCVLFTHRNW